MMQPPDGVNVAVHAAAALRGCFVLHDLRQVSRVYREMYLSMDEDLERRGFVLLSYVPSVPIYKIGTARCLYIGVHAFSLT